MNNLPDRNAFGEISDPRSNNNNKSNGNTYFGFRSKRQQVSDKMSPKEIEVDNIDSLQSKKILINITKNSCVSVI